MTASPIEMHGYRLVLGLAPRGKGSARGQPGRRAYTDPVTREWMRRAAASFREQWGGKPPLEGPLRVVIEAWLPRPRKYTLDGTGEGPPPPLEAFPAPVLPDNDNIEKGLWDALKKAKVIADDRLVVQNATSKWFVELDGEPGLEVLVSRVPLAGPRQVAGGGSEP